LFRDSFVVLMFKLRTNQIKLNNDHDHVNYVNLYTLNQTEHN